MKKAIFAVTIAVSLFASLGLTASANQNGLESQKQIIVNEESLGTVEPAAIPAVVAAARVAGSVATRAWKAIPAGDRALVTQALQSAIGLGGIEKSDNKNSKSLDELEYLFD